MFITVEGIEGSGKTLQHGLIADELKRRGMPVTRTLEPGGTEFGRELRKVLLHKDGAPREPLAELLIYLADRVQHLKEVVEPALSAGYIVLSDRYHDATLAYQGFARGVGLDRVDDLARILGIVSPDLTLIFDVDTEIGLRRARARNREQNTEDLGRFEAEDLAFHERVREGYHILAKRDPERIELVDAGGSPREVFAKVLEVLDRRL